MFSMKEKRILALFVLFLLALSFVPAIVVAQDAPTTRPSDDRTVGGDIFDSASSGGEDVGGFFSGIYNDFFKNRANKFAQSPAFGQFLLFILIALVIYSVGEFLPFLEGKDWVAGGIAIVIAALSTLYLTPQEVYSILLTYSTLGITLTIILPFLAISAISFRARDKGKSEFLGKFLWIVFLVVLTMKWITSDPEQVGTFGKWIFPLMFFGALIILVWGDRIFGIMVRQGDKSKIEFNRRVTAKATAAKAADAASVDAMSEAEREEEESIKRQMGLR